MIVLTLLLFPIVMDHEVTRLEGAFLTVLLATYLTYVFYRGRKAPAPLISEYSQLAREAKDRRKMGFLLDLGLLVSGTLGLLLGGRAIVESAVYLSRSLGISELGMGLTVVAIGTSLPELATSIMAAAKRQTDIAVGNVIGSNIFNILAVLGVTGIIKPIAVDPGVVWVELPAVVMLSLLVLLVCLSPMAKGEFRIRRWEGALLLGTYISLGYWIL
jgi:cation:H+ antiporter